MRTRAPNSWRCIHISLLFGLPVPNLLLFHLTQVERIFYPLKYLTIERTMQGGEGGNSCFLRSSRKEGG